ncbi:unnamed protein product [Durusdinium trenchii]|uniref:DNA-directed RNA polymerase III subunit RPC3 n=1 Tax=Durusdinium trenchii TaxID=1381693 RepID=A0ABP0SA64_9DINO
MDSESAIRVAADILEEQFGPVVARVGHVLLQRGPLRFQEILFYVQETQQEAVEFPALRNAMLVMLQHSLVSYQSPDESYLQVYKAESDEILARLRFPQYLEYVAAAKGEEAAEMLLLTLKYGRISKARLLKEAEAEMPPPELEKLLQQLVKERILRPDFDPRAEEARKRRRLEDSQDSKAETTEVVYRYDRVNLNLCICKNLLCRIVEEQVDELAAQVMMTMLTSVGPDSNERVMANWVSIESIHERHLGLFPNSGRERDPHRLREKLRSKLDLLVNKVEFLRHRRQATPLNEFTRLADLAARPARDGHEELRSEWIVDWAKAGDCLRSLTMSQLIRDRFGQVGLRIFNLLQEGDPPQKLEENHIFNICMIPLQEGREILQSMVKHSVLNLQQVARNSDGAVANSLWLYYVDMRRVWASTEELVLDALLNLRTRFRSENARIMPLESRAQSLTAKERLLLKEGRRVEDLLERGFLVLDSVLLAAKWNG